MHQSEYTNGQWWFAFQNYNKNAFQEKKTSSEYVLLAIFLKKKMNNNNQQQKHKNTLLYNKGKVHAVDGSHIVTTLNKNNESSLM